MMALKGGCERRHRALSCSLKHIQEVGWLLPLKCSVLCLTRVRNWNSKVQPTVCVENNCCDKSPNNIFQRWYSRVVRLSLWWSGDQKPGKAETDRKHVKLTRADTRQETGEAKTGITGSETLSRVCFFVSRVGKVGKGTVFSGIADNLGAHSLGWFFKSFSGLHVCIGKQSWI